MALKTILSPADKSNQFFLAIRMTDQTVQTLLWQIDAGQIKTLEISKIYNYTEEDSCVVQTDEALQELGKDSEGVEQTLFGLEPKWINGVDVVDAKKPLLEKLTKQLSLKPVGYVCVSEAMAQHFSIAEPLYSSLLLELSQSHLRVSLILRGQLASYQEVGQSSDLVADLREALARIEQDIGQDHFPPKIVLFSSDMMIEEELKKNQQLLMEFDWATAHPFLSAPMIDISLENLALQAMVSQGGVSIADNLKIELSPVTQVASEDQDFGFSDLPFEEKVEPENIDNLTAVDDQLAAAFGVVEHDLPVDAPKDPSQQLSGQVNKKNKKKFSFPIFKNLFKKKKKPLSAVADIKPAKKDSKLSHHPFIIAGFVGGLIVLAIIGFFYLYSSTQAVVKVKLKTQIISQDTQLTLDPKATSPDPEAKVLPAKVQTKSVSTGKTVETTGVKLIGDKAIGEVTIYNKTDGEKKFDKGTVLSDGSLGFILVDDVTVASASSTTESTIHGHADVKVEAQEIGAQSNLSKDTELSIASYDGSSYIAKVKEDLAGGSSREVRVVADEDMIMVKSELTKQLLEIAKKEFKDLEGDGVYFITTDNYSIETSKYDAEEGDEVSTLSLDLSLEVEALSYQVQDLKPLAYSLLESEIPEGYQMISDDPQILSSPVEDDGDGDQVLLEAQISTQAEPKIDFDELKKGIASKTIEQANSYLNSRDEISTFIINITPSLSAKIFKSLPKVEKIIFETL